MILILRSMLNPLIAHRPLLGPLGCLAPQAATGPLCGRADHRSLQNAPQTSDEFLRDAVSMSASTSRPQMDMIPELSTVIDALEEIFSPANRGSCG